MFPQIFGKYVLEREMASGGMARVYQATLRGAVGFEKRLVVKQIRPELASDSAFVERFVEEAKTAVELSHPNIVPVYELGVEEGVYYISMELCEGATLAEILRETGPLSPEEGAYVGAEICRGLDYAHRRAGIIHRDVTPRNVLVDEEGAVRLIDFGISAPAATDEGEATRTDILGSPGHMPPEQYLGANLTPAADVFAVGALLIEAWTGRPPFRRPSAAESKEALDTRPPSVAEHDASLEPLASLVESSVALEAEERPESAEVLARPLREFLKSADSGDLGRRLGELAKKARSKAEASGPWGAETISGDPESGGSDPSVTRTFAARDEMVEWTRKMSEPPPPDDAVGAESAETATPSDPGKTPKTVSVAPPPPESGPTTRKLESIHPTDDEEEQDDAVSKSAPGDQQEEGNRWLRPAILIAAIGGGALLVSELQKPPPVTEPTAATSPAAATTSSRPEPETRDAMAAPAPSEEPKQDGGKKTVPVVQTSSTAPTRPSAAPKVDAAIIVPAEKGVIAVSGQPATGLTANISGQNVTVPGQLSLPPGDYTVTISFASTNEHVTRRVSLGAGQRRSVQANFSGETPTATVN